MPKKFYTLKEAAKITKLSVRTLRNYIKDIKLDAIGYSTGNMQISATGLQQLRAYAKDRAKKTRQVRRRNIEKVRYSHTK